MTIIIGRCKIASDMSPTFQIKCARIKKIFAPLSREKRYDALIDLGRQLPSYPDELKTSDRVVGGCQSTLYLHSDLIDDKIFFQAHSDALISAGLAAILIAVYSGETPTTVLKCPPDFLSELGLAATLSLNRSNGLQSIHLRMKQDALKSFLKFCET